jgi:hypothetical protein
VVGKRYFKATVNGKVDLKSIGIRMGGARKGPAAEES